MTTHNKLKRWSVVLLLLSGIFLLNACSKGDKVPEDNPVPELVKDTAGKIPGFGNKNGEALRGNPFKLPDGIVLEGEIRGGSVNSIVFPSNGSEAENYIAAIPEHKRVSITSSAALRNTTSADPVKLTYEDLRGSGSLVTVVFQLKNNTGTDKIVNFPPGLVIKSNSGKYQNGVLIKKTAYTVQANATKRIVLLMYCGNLKLSASSESETYTFAVITNSASLHDLLDRLKNKKINVEQYASKDFATYMERTTLLQSIVWSITDGEGLTDEGKEWLDKLPND